ncbi:MAG: helix-turn-helix transcriptional regulator [Thermoclostridium sp.]|nr:helix-turn-helix transcriptional regulator [Thermoclostridium sp.]
MYIKNLVEMDLFPESFPIRIDHNKKPSFQYPAHWHKAAEITIARQNDTDIVINNQPYLLQEGDLVFIAGGDIHSYPVSNGGERVFILFDLQDMMNSHSLLQDYSLVTKSIFIRRNTPLHSKVLPHIEGILQEAANITNGSRFVILARIYDITALIGRNTNREDELSGSDRKDLLHKIGKVVDYIEKNYMEPITLKSAAENAGFSEHYLSRIFNRAVGSPFHLYLNKIRIKHAESKIILHDDSITEIAFSCGFNSIPTFNRLFREMKGCTPLEYRKMRWEHNFQKKGD